MPTIKTSELTGAALDWAVCEATGLLAAYTQFRTGKNFLKVWGVARNAHLHPSTNWSQGGPIIEREISKLFKNVGGTYTAQIKKQIPIPYEDRGTSIATHFTDWCNKSGETPLIAAMRCYCCAKLGDEIDIPEELCQQQSS